MGTVQGAIKEPLEQLCDRRSIDAMSAAMVRSAATAAFVLATLLTLQLPESEKFVCVCAQDHCMFACSGNHLHCVYEAIYEDVLRYGVCLDRVS